MRWKNPITPQTPRVCEISLDAPIQSAAGSVPVTLGFRLGAVPGSAVSAGTGFL
jgi:hypothetical protein